MHGQTLRSQDLWCRDVLPQSREFWRRPPRSKDEFMSHKEPNINLFEKKDKKIKKNPLKIALGITDKPIAIDCPLSNPILA